MIEVRDLHKSFSGRPVLRGVDLTVPRGSTRVILGLSGSGKTVLMKHIIGLLRPDSGQVLIEGSDITAYDHKQLLELRRKFGMVFQQAALFDSMSVGDNVAFPLREHTDLDEAQIRQKVREKLELVSLDNVEDKFPSELSGGMRKRVGLARAVVLDPSIILYDEPTTGLDPITTDQVDEMILEAKQKLNVTSIVISHDIASAFKIADHIIFVYDGNIVVDGLKDEMLACKHPFVQQFFATWTSKNA